MISGFQPKGQNTYEHSNLTQAKLTFAQTSNNPFARVELGSPERDVVQFSASNSLNRTAKKSVRGINVLDRLALLFGSSEEVTPLLAKEVNLNTLQYPVYASPKIDGWRGIIKGGKILTKSMKPVKNEMIQQALGQEQFNGLDGEMVAGSEVDPKVLRNTGSMLSRKNATGDFTFFGL